MEGREAPDLSRCRRFDNPRYCAEGEPRLQLPVVFRRSDTSMRLKLELRACLWLTLKYSGVL